MLHRSILSILRLSLVSSMLRTAEREGRNEEVEALKETIAAATAACVASSAGGEAGGEAGAGSMPGREVPLLPKFNKV
jgi:hypothetical protein